MREYLFRGKRKDNEEWVYGDLWCNPYGKRVVCIVSPINNQDTTGGNEVDTETIGQFIGLTDKNGKKIFEGDIFKFEDEVWQEYYTSCAVQCDSWEVVNYGVVGFNEELSQYDFVRYKFSQNSVEADLHENHDMTFADFITDLEVIGNIYDHPELMKSENNE